MKILDFMNENENWEEILQNQYKITIQKDFPYVLLKYRKDEIDFSNEIVRECRGAIFYYNEFCNEWECCCRPFDKFGNYGEDYAATNIIDWNSAAVREKVDGSLIKVWFSFRDKLWHISTNGTIDAYKAQMSGSKITFGEYFEKALNVPMQEFFDYLNGAYTYMFELVGPENKLVVNYENPAVYFLAARSNLTGNLYYNYEKPAAIMHVNFIKLPKVFPLVDLKSCIAATKEMTSNEEGFVVSDKFGNMVKIKSEEYLKAAHCYNNGNLSVKRAFSYIEEGLVDDFISYAPCHKECMIKISDWLARICHEIDYFGKLERRPTKKEHYEDLNKIAAESCFGKDSYVAKMIIAFGMSYYNDSSITAYDFVMNKKSKIIEVIEGLID